MAPPSGGFFGVSLTCGDECSRRPLRLFFFFFATKLDTRIKRCLTPTTHSPFPLPRVSRLAECTLYQEKVGVYDFFFSPSQKRNACLCCIVLMAYNIAFCPSLLRHPLCTLSPFLPFPDICRLSRYRHASSSKSPPRSLCATLTEGALRDPPRAQALASSFSVSLYRPAACLRLVEGARPLAAYCAASGSFRT